jgi:hypothetical protein
MSTLILGMPSAQKTTRLPKTKMWVEQQATMSDAMRHHGDEADNLLRCLKDLGLSDNVALMFCRTYVVQRRFWIEWTMCGENGTPADWNSRRCGFVRCLMAGERTQCFNLSGPELRPS